LIRHMSLNDPLLTQFESSMWVFFGTKAGLVKWVKLPNFFSQYMDLAWYCSRNCIPV